MALQVTFRVYMTHRDSIFYKNRGYEDGPMAVQRIPLGAQQCNRIFRETVFDSLYATKKNRRFRHRLI